MDVETQRLLKRAGWYPGRQVPGLVMKWTEQLSTDGFAVSRAAKGVLLEFGGLRIEQAGPGESAARASFSFDPSGSIGEKTYYADVERALGAALCPIGEVEDGTGALLIADDERTIVVLNGAWIIGTSFQDALDSLVLGRLGIPVSI